ncbi:hypothetical protein R3P38DRAFT_2843688 [Favolaschia claudopus]|uniref:HPt domain-containing protein n=1 Tax=Favolaschia claudopus TaxID=2862362 RepID=A0AAW0E1D3_9AGAR
MLRSVNHAHSQSKPISTSSAMNSPTRPPRPESVHSWWSDSNSIGPTISIHAAAKPLIRLMYHRQVRSFIKRNQETRLSAEHMEICLSYLAYKYISPATKSLILAELDSRVTSHRDVEAVHDSLEERKTLVSELLASPLSRIRLHTWNILRATAPLDSLISWVSLPQIFTAFSDADPEICKASRFAFIKCFRTSEGLDYCWDYLAHDQTTDTEKRLILNELDVGIVLQEDAENIASSAVLRWSVVAELLGSRDSEIRRHTWNIIQGSISRYMQTTIESLSDSNPHIREIAQSTLTLIVETSNDSLETLIESVPDPCLQRLSRDMIRRMLIQLQRIQSTATTKEVAATEEGAVTLARLSHSLKGARATCAAGFVRYAPIFLEDPSDLRLQTSTVLSNMAFHQTLLLTAEVETQLEDLARHPWDDNLREYALYALLC